MLHAKHELVRGSGGIPSGKIWNFGLWEWYAGYPHFSTN